MVSVGIIMAMGHPLHLAFGSWCALAVLVACCGDIEDAGPVTAASATSEDNTGTAASTPAEDAFAAELARLVEPHVDPAGVPGKAVGLVAAVVGPSLRIVAGFGATSIGGPAPRPDTIFELGSLTKAVTGVLLARALDRGTVALADPIDEVFPLGAPHFAGQAIALLDLATHTSGLPGMPNNTHSPDPRNPAAGYTDDDLAAFMSTHTLTSAPGARTVYSNLGAGTLGYYLVEDAGEASYEALVLRDLAAPLEMSDTRIVVPFGSQERLAQGYWQAAAAPANQIGEPLAGAGALRSTGADMLRFVEAALGTGDPAVVAAWARALEPQRPSPAGQGGQIGLLIGRETIDGRYRYFKDGQTAGFTAFLLFSTAPPAAVVLLANTSDMAETGALKTLARQILDAIPPA